MTLQEATEQPFVAKKDGDTEAARIAQERRKDDIVGATGILLTGVLTAAMLLGVFPYYINKNADKKRLPPKDVETARQQVHTMLKDPAFTDRLIEQLRDSSVIEKVTEDPEIMANLRKIAESIGDDLADSREKSTWRNKAARSNSAEPGRE